MNEIFIFLFLSETQKKRNINDETVISRGTIFTYDLPLPEAKFPRKRIFIRVTCLQRESVIKKKKKKEMEYLYSVNQSLERDYFPCENVFFHRRRRERN